jgi:hypothetical protein
MSFQVFLHCLPEPEWQQALRRYGLKPGTSAAPLPLPRHGVRRTPSDTAHAQAPGEWGAATGTRREVRGARCATEGA